MGSSSAHNFLDGDGAVRSLLRRHDWSAFPAGHPDQWPAVICRTLRMILDSDSPMSFLWGPDLRYFYNDAYLSLIDAKHPAALTRPFWESWTEVREIFAPILDRAIRGEFFSMENMEFSVMRRGMQEKTYFSFSLLPLFDERGIVFGILNPATETTDQRLASRRQQFQLQLADRIRPLADPDEVVTVASEMLGKHLDVGRVVYAEAGEAEGIIHLSRDWSDGSLPSIAGSRLQMDDFGRSISALLQAGDALIVGDLTTDRRSMPYAEAYATMGIRAVLAIPLMKEGRLQTILSLHDSQARHWTEHEIALARDTVDRIWSAVESAQTRTELRYERDQSQYVFDSMTEGFAILDCNWTVLRMNSEGLRIAQREEHEVIGKNHWDLWPELKGTSAEEIYRQVKTTYKADVVEFPYNFPDGRQGWMEVRVYPALDEGIAFFFRDITTRKSNQERLKEADRRKDEFLAMLAHELRNPLAPIGAAAELLQTMQLDASRIRQTSQVIGRQVRHMTSLVDDLLDVSRVTRGQVELDNMPIDVSHIVTDAIEQVTPLLRSRGHHLALHQTPDATMVFGDRKRLVQILANLLNNAAKYTPEGGNIELRTDVHNSHILIKVSDDGIGMAPDLVSRAFDLFTQAERTSDRSSGGLGLGLALVKSLVELHHGTVACESAGPGKGSTFTICLPRLPAKEQSEATHYHEHGVAETTQPLRILIVDDNADAASMLALLLDAAGHQVLVEHGARKALERARKEVPQVCLLDIGLPEMDGNELAKRLRAQPETADAVLIAVTGYGQENDRKQTTAAGFDHHLVKPVDTEMLMAILADIGKS